MTERTELPATTFTDASGREWAIVFGPDELADVHSNLGLDLAAEVEADAGGLFERIASDPRLLGAVLLLACWRSAGWTLADATGEPGLAFLRRARADAANGLRPAVALLGALGAAFPASPALREMIAAAPKWIRKNTKHPRRK